MAAVTGAAVVIVGAFMPPSAAFERTVAHSAPAAVRARSAPAGFSQPSFAESFTGTATTPNAWSFGGSACLTAGTVNTPPTSVPACGASAPQDPPGGGALELTPPINNQLGFVFLTKPFATSAGLSVKFDYYSFDSSGTAGDGLALIVANAGETFPTRIGGCCGSLGYAAYKQGPIDQPGLLHGYLAVGLDESGNFSTASYGKTGGLGNPIPNIITVRGSAKTKQQYLFSTTNAQGQPAALPFSLDAPNAPSRPTALTFDVTLTAAGLLSVSIDRHDGDGPATYLGPTPVGGTNGQPSLPPKVYLGLCASGGNVNSRHQVNAFAVGPAALEASVLTYHNDSDRTGWNADETALTTTNVNGSSFGLQHVVTLDGRVDAQPLVLPNQPVEGLGVHDVVYVATQNDTVYAIDAESGAVLVSRNLGQSIPYTQKDYDDNIYPVYGIASTPVIDPANNALYLVTDTNEGVNAPDVYRLHKLALNNLSDVLPSVVLMPTTILNDGTTYVFPPMHERQRAGLLEAYGTIYVGFSSTGDTRPLLSRGVVAGFSAATLTPLQRNLFPNRRDELTNPFYLSSVWQSGFGPAADGHGSIYFSTGNSNPDYPSYDPTYNFPDSLLRVSSDLSTIQDSFTPYNYFGMDQADADFGSGGTLLLPDQTGGIYPHLVVAGGKDGKAYVLNRDRLGGYVPNGPNADLLELASGPCWCGPAYFMGADRVPRIVTGGGAGVQTWRLTDGTSFSVAAEGQVSATLTNGQPDNGGTLPTISSNGTNSGSAVLWFVQRPNDTNSFTLNLRAFDAQHLANQLFSAPAGNWTNFNSNAIVTPTVANGRVYVASYLQLQIFGLLENPR